jgi:dynein heavy chain, axonemal
MNNDPKAKEWTVLKKFLIGLKINFLKEKATEILSVREDVINYIKKEISKDWDIAVISKKNQVAGYFAKYIAAMIEVYAKKKEAKPLLDKLEVMKANLAEAKAKLDLKLDQLNQVKAKVEKLESDFKATQDKIDSLNFNIEKNNQRLVRAKKLVGLLKDEGERWKESVEIKKIQIVKLIGDVFIAAASISYIGPFTGTYRNYLIRNDWIKKC